VARLASIAIEDTGIKLLEVDGREIKVAVSVPLEPGLVKDGVVLDKPGVSSKLRQLLETNKVTSRRVIASISGIHSVYRLIGLPRLPKGLLAEAVKREAERIMPVPLGELHLYWQAIPSAHEEALVCLLGLPRGTVDTLMDTLRQNGLDPYIMDARPLAIARACGATRAIAINVEGSDFDIVVVINGVPELVRSLAFSRFDLIPPSKASEIKEELERTIRFYNAGHEAAPITEDMPVIIGSEAALAQILSEELPYSVKPLTAPLSCSRELNIGDFMANVGLILKELKIDRSSLRLNLNALPEVHLPKPVPIFPIISWLLVAATVCLLAWFGLTTREAIARTSALKGELSQAQELMKARQIAPKEVSELEVKLKEVTAVRDGIQRTLTDLEQQRAEVGGDLGKAISLLPSNVTLNGFEYATTLTIKGVAPDSETISDYAKSLRDSGRFSEVTVSFNTTGYHEVAFTLTLK